MKIAGIEKYNGSKSGNGVYQQIISIIPPHYTLVVPFLGHCGIVRNIFPADTLIAMDASARVIEFWKRFLVEDLLYISNDERSLFSKTKQSKGTLPSTIILKVCDSIKELSNMKFDNTTVIYLDPPYPFSARKSNSPLYQFEMTDKQHSELLSLIVKIKANILISTYDNVLYQRKLNEWNKIQFFAGTRNGRAIETVYYNYSIKNGKLHDYRYLGKNFKDRERIKLKIQRWVNRLKSLDSRERMAIISAIISETKNPEQ